METQETEKYFLLRKVPFSTVTGCFDPRKKKDPKKSNFFPLKTGLLYAKVLLKTDYNLP